MTFPGAQPGNYNGVVEGSSAVQANGGGSTQYRAVGYRDVQDARRSMSAGQIPSAAYPDGYLGSIQSRRSDRLLDSVKNKLTNRSYQRGVHKGERIDPADYFWNDRVNPSAGLEAEARGQRWTATGSVPAEQLTHMGKVAFTSPDEMAKIYANYGVKTTQAVPHVMNDAMRDKYKSLRPGWR